VYASKLLTLEDVHPGGVVALLDRAWPAWEPKVMPTAPAVGATVRVAGVAVPAEPVAVVNHGRWVAHCPYCPGAQLACATDTRFFCLDCFHAEDPAALGKWLAVRWPDRETLRGVTEALLKRPRMETRNWQPAHVAAGVAKPGEPVEGLRAENALRVTDHLLGQVFEA